MHSGRFPERTRTNHPLPRTGIAGPFAHIFNPNDTRKEGDSAWYTNDHTLVKSADGTWHAYGIIHHLPVRPWDETRFFHASAASIRQAKWEDHGYAMTALPGVEGVLWAPHVIREKGTYYMFYNTGNMQKNAPEYASWGQLRLATSNDLLNWKRHDRNPLFSDPGHARDSYILKHNGRYYYYYTRVPGETDLRSAVAVRTSPDLLHWSGPKIAHLQPYEIYWGGDAESRFVVHKDGLFYLFVCKAMTAYNHAGGGWSPHHHPERKKYRGVAQCDDRRGMDLFRAKQYGNVRAMGTARHQD